MWSKAQIEPWKEDSREGKRGGMRIKEIRLWIEVILNGPDSVNKLGDKVGVESK